MEPTEILGVSADATDDEIRTAYLSKVQEHPPDRSPEQFELIRDAYEALLSTQRTNLPMSRRPRKHRRPKGNSSAPC